jgi:hypothetical protein
VSNAFDRSRKIVIGILLSSRSRRSLSMNSSEAVSVENFSLKPYWWLQKRSMRVKFSKNWLWTVLSNNLDIAGRSEMGR